MKKFIFVLLLFVPVLAFAQGQKGSVSSCAPVKDGKVCYEDDVEIEGLDKTQIFEAINKWAKENYGKDVFISSISSKKKKGKITITSRVELLLNETEKTVVKYRVNIVCKDGGYHAEMYDIIYQYTPGGEADDKKISFKTYPAEDVIVNDGKANVVEMIKDPKLFCNATFFFAENLFGDIYNSIDEE